MPTNKDNYHNVDRAKVLYGQIMMAAAPMFERLDSHDQFFLIRCISNDLVTKIQLQEACLRDVHILNIPEESIVEEAVESSPEVPNAE